MGRWSELAKNTASVANSAAKRSKKDLRQQVRARRRLWSGLAWGAAGFALLAAFIFGAWNLLRSKPGQGVALQARTHIQIGDDHEPYNTNPPTSGAHAGLVQADFYDVAPADENLVHNLEHGYVIIWYNCATMDQVQCQSLKTDIQGVMSRARPVVIASNIKKLVAVPRLKLDTPIALTSWGRIDTLRQFDEKEMMDFINTFREQAPEAGAP